MSLARELDEAQGSAVQRQDAPAATVAYTGVIDMVWSELTHSVLPIWSH